MKPQYVLLLMWAVFITFLADGISWAFMPIPALGPGLAVALSLCINITMGAGLVLALASLGMWHPRLGPFGIIAGLIPGVNFLPFWVGLVVAGIVYKTNAEGKDLDAITNTALKLQSTYLSNKNPLQKMRDATGIVMNERRATGRPPQNTPVHELQNKPEQKSRELPNLTSPGMHSDIAPPRAGNNSAQLHAKTA